MLEKILDNYRTRPDFLGTELVHPNQRGAVDDTPLHIAVRRGKIEDIDTLVACGGDINIAGDLGNTPLHYAAMSGNARVVKRLIELGANPSIKNEFSETPVQVAKLAGNLELVRILGA